MLPSAEPEATVVVCEDDPPTLDLLCDHLHADRFEALAAPSAADALRPAITTTPTSCCSTSVCPTRPGSTCSARSGPLPGRRAGSTPCSP